MAVEGFAPAKVNLTLHVTGQRQDGYHLLDSLVAFADIGDHLTLTPGPDLTLEVSGAFCEGVPTDARNLVWKAAVGAGWSGGIHLQKSLPHGAGIGGGSSDAAAVLRAVAARGGHVPGDLALSLGADVPVCMVAKAARMQGIGEQITPVTLPELPAILVNPRLSVPTPQVFKALSSRANSAMPFHLPDFASAGALALWLAQQRNDLEAPALACQPVIGQVLSALSSLPGVCLARMSGSGATCFALFERADLAAENARVIAASHPGWWVQPTVLR